MGFGIMMIVFKKEPLSSLALGLHRLQVRRGLHLSSAQLRPQQLTLLFSSLLSSHFPSCSPVSESLLSSIPLPQCFHPALITPICRHSSTCLSLARPLLRFHWVRQVCRSWHHWLLLLSVSKCRLNNGSPFISLKQNECDEGSVTCSFLRLEIQIQVDFMTLKLA